jgi:hypothetical protein
VLLREPVEKVVLIAAEFLGYFESGPRFPATAA